MKVWKDAIRHLSRLRIGSFGPSPTGSPKRVVKKTFSILNKKKCGRGFDSPRRKTPINAENCDRVESLQKYLEIVRLIASSFHRSKHNTGWHFVNAQSSVFPAHRHPSLCHGRGVLNNTGPALWHPSLQPGDFMSRYSKPFVGLFTRVFRDL